MKQAEIIRRCQQGDRQAMGLLYTTMHDELLAVSRHYVADPDAAEDVLHDAFLLIFSKIADLRQPKSASNWMHTVVKNVALLYVQRQRQQQKTTVSLDDLDGNAAALAVAPSAAGVTYEELMSYVDALPSGCRQVFRLSVLEGLNHRQIASLLNIEPHSSSSQLFRARHLLQQSLRVLLSLLAIALPFGGYWWLSHTQKPTAQHTDLTAPTQMTVPASPFPSPSQGGEVAATSAANPSKANPSLANASLATPSTAHPSTSTPSTATPELPADSTDLAPSPLLHLVPRTSPLRSLSGILNPRPSAPPRSHTPSTSLALAYSGGPTASPGSLPYGAHGMNGQIGSVAHHRLSLTLSLDAHYRLTRVLSLHAGLSYTLLSSTFDEGNTYLYSTSDQRLHYLGLTLGASTSLWQTDRWRLYTKADATCDLPLGGTLKTTYVRGTQTEGEERLHLSPSSCWSVGVAAGAEYRLTPTLGIFVEPGVHYYFDPGDGLESWRTQHPFTFTVPLGVRISF